MSEWAKERARDLLDSWYDRSRMSYDTDLISETAIEAAFNEAEQRVIARLREPDDAMIEVVAKALWRLECIRADADEHRAGRTPPAQWADPWHESGCGIRQQKQYTAGASTVSRALAAFLSSPPQEG